MFRSPHRVAARIRPPSRRGGEAEDGAARVAGGAGRALRLAPAPRLSRGAVTELCEWVNLDPGFRRGDVQAVWVLLIARLATDFYSVIPAKAQRIQVLVCRDDGRRAWTLAFAGLTLKRV